MVDHQVEAARAVLVRTREASVLAGHVARQVRERAVAARAYTGCDAVLQSRFSRFLRTLSMTRHLRFSFRRSRALPLACDLRVLLLDSRSESFRFGFAAIRLAVSERAVEPLVGIAQSTVRPVVNGKDDVTAAALDRDELNAYC
jgi:hypothetical protein